MRITVCGAAGEVTGSGYLVETKSARVLVDFGIFQGRGADEKNAHLTPNLDPKRLDALVLTHAHLDHSGRLPMLSDRGMRCKVHATPATRDLAELLLKDSAHLQEADVARTNRRLQRQHKPLIEPLYSAEDVERVTSHFLPLPYNESREIADGIRVRLVDAGHMLGSASVEMIIGEGPSQRTVVFSGDLGPRGLPYLRDPTPLDHAHLVFLESTYGDRDHKSLDTTLDEFRAILRDAYQSREKVLIPTFAVGRSQQILYHIAEFVRDKSVPRFPVFLDSPMAIQATKLYAQHQDLFDEEAGRLYREKRFQRDLSELEFCQTADDSRKLNNLRDAAVILAASGMCEGGRILHHLKHNLWRKYVHVIFVGYQAEGTLGSRIVHGAKVVHVLGEPIVVDAHIHTLGGFSAHAGQSELVEWTGHLAAGKPRVALTHGEQPQREALAAAIKNRLNLDAELPPQAGAQITLD